VLLVVVVVVDAAIILVAILVVVLHSQIKERVLSLGGVLSSTKAC
jgi:hypothetical protein